MTATRSETDLLTADREVAAIERACDERIEQAREYAEWALRQGRTTLDGAQAWVAEVATRATAARDLALAALFASRAARVELTIVPDVAHDDCASGSCQLARPGGPCDCACGGTAHGSRSTLAPAACNGTKMLTELAEGGGYRYPRCPGCPACTRPRLVVVGAPTRDLFTRLPQVDGDDALPVGYGRGRVAFDADGWPID